MMVIVVMIMVVAHIALCHAAVLAGNLPPLTVL